MNRHILLTFILTLAFALTCSEATAKSKKRGAHHRVVRPKIAAVAVPELSPVPPEPAKASSRIESLLEQVQDRTQRPLSDEYRGNPCELFDDEVAIVEPGRIICRNAIYALDTASTAPYWVETDRARDKIEQQTMAEVPTRGSVVVTHTLGGTTQERGLYLAKGLQ